MKSATLETEIPVLEVEGEQRYNGSCRRAEALGDECHDVQFLCFHVPAEPRTRIGTRELTVFDDSKGMRLGDST